MSLMSRSKQKHIFILCNNCESNLTAINDLKKHLLEIQAAFESRLTAIETALSVPRVEVDQQEELIQESVERTLRAINVILVNVPENPSVPDVIVANENDILEIINPPAVSQLLRLK